MIDPSETTERSQHPYVGALSVALGAVPALILLSFMLHAPMSYGQSTAPANPVGNAQPPRLDPNSPGAVELRSFAGGGATASEMVQVPVSKLFPGNVAIKQRIENPVAGDPDAAQRGMTYFTQMNCVGCHAANGVGGIGPALSNSQFIYGSEPENIYLTILQGRPNGMPAWGGMLPDAVIWDLVAYVKSISKEPLDRWGKTTSAESPAIEQVPAEYMKTTEPWNHTQKFSFGQPPYKKVEGSTAPETPPPQ